MDIYFPEEVTPVKKTRTKKSDRAFSPPTLGYTDAEGVFVPIILRPSNYRIAEKLNEHVLRVRNDDMYARNWYAYASDRMEDIVQEEKQRLLQEVEPECLMVRASSIKDCARKTVFSLLKVEGSSVGNDRPHWAVSATIGELIHREIRIMLEYLGCVLQSEEYFHNQTWRLTGHPDHILDPTQFTHPDTGMNNLPMAVLDVKTVGPDDFKAFTWSEKVPGYVAQVSAYGAHLGVAHGVVLMVDRGSGKWLDFEFEIPPDYGLRMLQRAKAIAESADKRLLPSAEAITNGKMAYTCYLFCPYQSQCMEEEQSGSVQRWLNSTDAEQRSM